MESVQEGNTGEVVPPAVLPHPDLQVVFDNHGVLLTTEEGSPSARAASAATDPNADIPQHTCGAARCACWPCIVGATLSMVCCICCREPLHPVWAGQPLFATAISVLRTAGGNIHRSMCALRLITDPPIGRVPVCLVQPCMKNGSVGCAPNTVAPNGGEWYWQATGPGSCGDSCCTCCCRKFPGDPQMLPGLGQPARVVLYLHGGAFALCSSQTHRALLMRIVDVTGAVVLCPDYRRPPEHPWPAPVDDCLQTYRWMLEEGQISADNIVFAGDSAGGGLAVAVMAAARAAGLPLPRGGVLWSPWLDLTDSFSGSWTSNQNTDYLPRDLAASIARGYAGEHSLAAVSPASVSLRDLPPLLVEVGVSECLYDQIDTFVKRAKRSGVDVEYHPCEGMVHVYPLFASFSKKESDPVRAFERMAAFMEKLFSQQGKSDEASQVPSLTPVDAEPQMLTEATEC